MLPARLRRRVSGEGRLLALERLGLRGYHARAYLALLDHDAATARDVAHRGRIPKGRVYEVLGELHAAGAIDLLPESPKRYRAAPFAQLFDRRVRARLDEAEALRGERERLVALFPSLPTPASGAPSIVMLREAEAFEERARAVLARADREVLALGPAALGPRLAGWGDVVREAQARGVRWRALLAVEPASSAAAGALASWGVEVRHRPAGADADAGVVVEGRRRVLVCWGLAAGPRGEAPGFVVEDLALAATLAGAFDDLWERGAPLDARLAELQRGGKEPEPHGPSSATRPRRSRAE